MLFRHGARLAALIAPFALLAPAVAHAETVTVPDGAGDAKAYNFGAELGEVLFGADVDGEQPTFLDAPSETAVDVLSTDITHAKRVTVAIRFRDLADVEGHSVEMRVFTPRARFTVIAGGGSDGASDAMLIVDRVRGNVLHAPPCRSVRLRYDLAADTATVSFPARCIEDPQWIRVAAGVSRIKATAVGDGSVNLAAWVDDAFRSRVSENSMGRSPKVRRG